MLQTRRTARRLIPLDEDELIYRELFFAKQNKDTYEEFRNTRISGTTNFCSLKTPRLFFVLKKKIYFSLTASNQTYV